MPREDYEQRKQARIDRYKDRADKADQNSKALLDSARDMASAIPFGQPILVGHHSERRDRNYRKRIQGKFDKAFKEGKRADHWEQKAASAESNQAISSDDPEAVAKLKLKIAVAERSHAIMKAANQIIRRKPKNEATPEKTSELVALTGMDEAKVLELFTPDFCGRIGFPGYALTNNNANIRRMEQRLASLEREAKAEYKETEYDGFTVVENVDENRVQIIFDAKPDAEVRRLLKTNGFRWARSNGAWQRLLNNTGRNAAAWVVEKLLA